MDASPRASATDTTGTSTNGSGRRGVIELARVAVADTIRLVQQEVQLARPAYAALNKAFGTGEFQSFLDRFCDPQIVFRPAGLLQSVGLGGRAESPTG